MVHRAVLRSEPSRVSRRTNPSAPGVSVNTAHGAGSPVLTNETDMTPLEVDTSMVPSGAETEVNSGREPVSCSTNRTGALAPPDDVRPSPNETSMHPLARTTFENSSHEEHAHPRTEYVFRSEVQECSRSTSSTVKLPTQQSSGIFSVHVFGESAEGTRPNGNVMAQDLSDAILAITLS